MKKGTLLLIIALFMFFLSVFMQYYLLVSHENAHRAVCETFGGDAEISYNWLHGQTTCTDMDMSQEYKLAQSSVDAYGYQFSMFLTIICMSMTTFLALIFIICEVRT